MLFRARIAVAAALAVSCGARTELGAPIRDASAPFACTATGPAVLVPAPAPPDGTIGWVTINTLTVLGGRLYWELPMFTAASGEDGPGGVASVPVGGGAPTVLVTTSSESPWDAGFVLDAANVTYFDEGVRQAPLGGGGPSLLANGFGEILAIGAAGADFLVSDGRIARVGAGGAVTVLSTDARTVGTSTLAGDGDVVFGGSREGVYRLDGDAVTFLGGDPVDRLVVDGPWIDYALREGGVGAQRVIGARVSKNGGPVTYFLSPLPFDPSDELGDNGVAIDDASIYFGDDGSVDAVSKTTGVVTVVASASVATHVTTTSVAVDDRCVYWSNSDNSIWVAPKD